MALERTTTARLPWLPVLGSFFLFTVPLTIAVLSPLPPRLKALLVLPYFWAVGATHFLLTPLLYAQSRSRRHFLSSTTNAALYVAAPALVLLSAALGGSQTLSAGAALWGGFVVRVLGSFHVNRQSFGVLQLFKRDCGLSFPGWARRIDNALFISLFLLQSATLADGLSRPALNGAFRLEGAAAWAMTSAAALLLLAAVAAFARSAASAADARRLTLPAAYLLLQTCSSLLAVYRSALLLPSLAMHYCEYHVLMWPRCLAPLDPVSRSDRVLRWLGDRPLLLYAALAGAAALLVMRAGAGAAGPGATGALVSLPTGVFLVHYLLDAFLWRSADPFHRRAVESLRFDLSAAPEAA